MPDDDNVYLGPVVIRQILDDLAEMRFPRRLTRQRLIYSRPYWRCGCGTSAYEDFGDRIQCLACGREYEVGEWS